MGRLSKSGRYTQLTSSRFLTDYFHTVVILIVGCYFSVKAFTYPEIGSIGRLYDLVKAASERHPVAGNEQGTYLTMTSKDAILFGILHLCANFGLVVVSNELPPTVIGAILTDRRWIPATSSKLSLPHPRPSFRDTLLVGSHTLLFPGAWEPS